MSVRQVRWELAAFGWITVTNLNLQHACKLCVGGSLMLFLPMFFWECWFGISQAFRAKQIEVVSCRLSGGTKRRPEPSIRHGVIKGLKSTAGGGAVARLIYASLSGQSHETCNRPKESTCVLFALKWSQCTPQLSTLRLINHKLLDLEAQTLGYVTICFELGYEK